MSVFPIAMKIVKCLAHKLCETHTHIVNGSYSSCVFCLLIFPQLYLSVLSLSFPFLAIFYGLLLVVCRARVLIVVWISILFSFSCTFLSPFFLLTTFSFTFFIGV